jgi:hypothetical protein
MARLQQLELESLLSACVFDTITRVAEERGSAAMCCIGS